MESNEKNRKKELIKILDKIHDFQTIEDKNKRIEEIEKLYADYLVNSNNTFYNRPA